MSFLENQLNFDQITKSSMPDVLQTLLDQIEQSLSAWRRNIDDIVDSYAFTSRKNTVNHEFSRKPIKC